MFKKLSPLLLVVSLASSAHATSVDESTSVGSQTFIESVSGLGYLTPDTKNSKTKRSKAQWNLGYTFDRTKVVDPTTKIAIVDKTSQVNGGLTWKDKSNWSLGAGLNYSVTPDENLREFGPQLTAGYKIYFRPANKKADFKPDIGAKLTLARLNYTQTFQATKARGRRKNIKPTTGKNQINQNMAKLDLSGDVWEWLSVGAYAAVYSYNKDVNQFLNTLDSARSVSGQSASGLSSTVSGLPSAEQGVDFSIYFSDDWDFSARYSRAMVASDHSRSSTLRGEVSYDISDKWNIGVGAEYDHLVGFNETLGILTAAYSF